MRASRFQIDIATGRFTLPVVILICLLLWALSFNHWSDLGSLLAIAATTYLMIETSTAFGLIRTRTTFQISLYIYLASALLFLHPFEWENLLPILFSLAVSQLFHSYETRQSVAPVYNVFFFISLGSLLFPPFLFYAPFFLFSLIWFRAMSVKGLFAALLGLLTPYWFLFGYAFWVEDLSLFYQPLVEFVHIQPLDFKLFPLHEWISWGVVATMNIVSGIHYLRVAYKDKTRTRIYLTFLVVASGWTLLFTLLQPTHLHVLLPIQIIGTAILSGHLFSLTRNRFSGIYFIVTFVALILLTLYNIWMRFFTF